MLSSAGDDVRRLEEVTDDDGGGIIDVAAGTAGPFIVDPLGELFGCAQCPRVLLKYDPRGVPVIGGPDGNKRRGRIRCPRCRTLCSFPEYEGPPRPGMEDELMPARREAASAQA
jgi:hypothetical protein